MNLHKKTNVIIISHFSFKPDEKSDVFPQNIRDFLIKKIGNVTYIDHPFPDATKFPASQIRIYDKTGNTFQLTTPKIMLPILLLYAYQLFLTTCLLLIKPLKYDLCIVCDNLSLISVYFFRKLGVIKKIVYYTVDYTPQRYNNYFLNLLYHFLDRLSCRISDTNWVAVENMLRAKINNGLKTQESSPFQVVPMGFSTENITIKPVEDVDRFHLVFVGLLFEKQGLQLVLKAFPTLISKFPRIHLTVIGSGPYEAALKLLVKHQRINSYVTFTGLISNHREIITFLTKNAGVGLATYNPSIGDYTYNADPSKIKLYLLCGLPIITTKVPPIAEKINDKKAGITIDYSIDNLVHGMETLLDKKETYKVYRKNALIMGRSYDISKILDTAFRKL